jgi:HAD superfamily hydrolase (TIGR01490 family)
MTSTPPTKARPFAVFDIDGTLIRWQLYHSVADTLARLGHMDPELHRRIKDARMVWKRRAGGFADYERELIGVYDQTITRLTREQLETAAQAVFDEYKDQAYTYTRDLIAELKAKGYLLFAISGSQREIVSKIAGYYLFDDFTASIYEYIGGHFTGKKQVVAWDKKKALEKLVEKHGAVYEGSLAIGDSRSDISLLECAETPIAFNPDKSLFEQAKRSGWKVVIERKDMVYELEAKGGRYELVKTN